MHLLPPSNTLPKWPKTLYDSKAFVRGKELNHKEMGEKKSLQLDFLKGPAKLAAARHHVELCKLS